ncbi:MAG TPA: ROK family protein [Chthoniobacteraceae bacterium]|jgi:glucokinase|nr:ROK family protein [Chthoniobacteraceae bacterium]
MNLLAIEIGGSKLQLVVGNAIGRILVRFRSPVDRSLGAEGIRALIAEALPSLIENWKLRAIGVGYGGPVDWRTGRIVKSHHIEGWNDFPLAEWLTSLSGLPAIVENDANVAALGEALHGAGVGFNPVFWVNIGSGIGGGLVVDGRLYHGATPGEAEIGHLRLDRDGTIVEDRCSGWSIDRRIREEIQREPDSALAQLVAPSRPGCEARHLGAALAQGDPLAQRILDDALGWLAFALSHVVQLFHPEVIVVGGGLSLLDEPVRAGIEKALPQFVMDAFLPGPKIVLAKLCEDAVPVGALALAASHSSSSS